MLGLRERYCRLYDRNHADDGNPGYHRRYRSIPVTVAVLQAMTTIFTFFAIKKPIRSLTRRRISGALSFAIGLICVITYINS